MLPSNTELERFVVGYALLEPDRIPDLCNTLRPDDFSLERHRRIFTQIVRVYEDQGHADLPTVGAALHDAGEREVLSSLLDLRDLTEGLPHNAHIERYIELLQAHTLRRNLMTAGHWLELAAAAPDSDGMALAERVKALIDDAMSRSASSRKLWQSPQTLVDAAGGLRAYLSQQRAPGIDSPWSDLNSLLVGLLPGDLCVVAARPSVGKSVVGLQLGQHAAFNGHRTMVASLEMTNQDLNDRLIAEVAGVPGLRVRDRNLTSEEMAKAERAYPDLKIPLHLYDSPLLRTVMGIRAQLRQLIRDEGPVEMVIIDHFLLMDSPGRFESHRLMLTSICHALKFLAKEMNLVVVLLTQLNRNTENEHRPPILADLKETGTLEEDADEVLLIHRPGVTRPDDPSLRGKANFILAKHRNGPTGIIPMAYRDHIPRFDMLAVGEYQG